MIPADVDACSQPTLADLMRCRSTNDKTDACMGTYEERALSTCEFVCTMWDRDDSSVLMIVRIFSLVCPFTLLSILLCSVFSIIDQEKLHTE